MGASVTTRYQTPLDLTASIAGRYRIVRELGRGGMATVYLAKDSARDEQLVAIKMLHPDLAASIGADRFLREIELGKVLQHDRIVSVIDSGETVGQLYYTMPFVDGESLRDRLERQKQLTIDETIALTRQIATALDFAHARGVVHRDIKPENILLAGDQAFVMDFGIAHAVTTAGGEKLTQTGMAVGTPAYMSPEQAVGAKDVTPHSDVYSLACVVYEMLAGEPPFVGANAMALLAKHSLEAVPSIRVVRASVPEQLEDAIFCALEKTPVDRFASVGDFARALAGEIAVPRHTTQRTMTPRRGAQHATRHRRLLIGGMVAAVVLVAAAAAMWQRMIDGGADAAARVGTDTDPTRIAVLYFEDGSTAKDLSFLSEGLTEALIHELSAVKQLRVISRNGVTPLKGKSDIAPDSIGRLLKVGTIVSGKLVPSGNTIRLDVSLVDALTNKEIGSTRLDHPRDSVMALQDELAKDVAQVLRRKLGQEIRTAAGRVGTRNAKAWEALQRAKQSLETASELTRAGNAPAAMQQLEAVDGELAVVEALDGKWVEPVVQRAWVAYQQARLAPGIDVGKLPAYVEAGVAHAERALSRAPTDANALEARGTLRYWGWLRGIAADPTASGQLLRGAEDDLKAATRSNPLQASAWNVLSHLFLAKVRPSEAKIAADRAYEADPYLTDIDRTIWRRFQGSLDLGNRDEAIKACNLGRRRFPENFRFAECQLWLHAMIAPTKPAPADIWRDYSQFVERSPKNVRAFHEQKGRMMVALGLVRAGLPDSARRLAEVTQEQAANDPENELLYLRAVVHAQIPTPKDKDSAIRLLSRFLAASPQRAEGEGQDESWWMRSLRSDSRYQALVGK